MDGQQNIKINSEISKITEFHVCGEINITDIIRGLLEKYPTFGREKETGLLGALDT